MDILSFLKIKKNVFPGSAKYWENRYKNGGNSGAGSYNKLADFKAEFINNFVHTNNIKKVIEFGCGDGNQLTLANYKEYVGYDVSLKSIEMCRYKFKSDSTKRFLILPEKIDFDDDENKSDLVLSLDVIFHLIEDEVYTLYMDNLFKSSTKYVIIYSSNYNSNDCPPHVRHRRFTDYIEKKHDNYKQIAFAKNKYSFDVSDPNNTSSADFYVFEKI